ncbi:flagellar basal body-associated FliL family protein [Anaerosalibacter massiliensis]|uniref:Flagellar protein FliL n=1 Tax=Anaerosalibacter massiliensis TaxID=1347392 RepID=A0A9X2S3T4_9FIRM|nr:flagellar basal body-associated FliL family protein [Anaerosalibacter massiliensis]MCR2042763.1 flagellar basal body-associated FliL family protein [Anaerosalibacter massiliensis]
MDTKKTILIVLLVILILFAVAGLILGFSIYKNSGDKNKDIEKYYITLEEMYCNIKDSKKIIKLKATIEINNKKTYEELEEKQFLMRNEINKIIRNKEEKELLGKEGQVALQNEIKDSLIKLFDNGESISNVYFDELIIQ